LKEFRNEVLIVHTDHENLTYKIHSDRVMRWRLFIEEYSPDLRYIKGENNIVADALSRLEIANETMEEAHFNEEIHIIILLHTRDLPLMRTILLKSRQAV
jgi:hypothetical protein